MTTQSRNRAWQLVLLAWALMVGSAGASTTVIVTFQDGTNGYSGTVDTWWGDGAVHGSDTYLRWNRDGEHPPANDYRPALRFDNALSTLPANAFILSATITLTRNGSTGLPYEDGDCVGWVTPVTADWSESSTTVTSPNSSQYTLIQAHWASGVWPAETARDVDITAYVRAWHAGTMTNRGVALIESNNQFTDLALHSSEAAEIGKRPKLTIQYVLPGLGQRILLLADGLNGYAGTDDTWLGSTLTDTNYGTGSVIYMGRNQPSQAGAYGIGLLRFELDAALDSLLGAGWRDSWRFEAAWLGFHNGAGALGQSLTAHPLSSGAAWTENGATWSTRDGANPWPAAWVAGGAPPAANVLAGGAETLVKGALGPTPPTIVGMSLWDVSTTVRGCLNGSLTNNGWVLPSYFGTSGGSSGASSSESSVGTVYRRPFLALVMLAPRGTIILLR